MNRLGHTLSGVAAGVWSLPIAPITGAAGSVVWVAATTGYALSPDLDHPASTAARMCASQRSRASGSMWKGLCRIRSRGWPRCRRRHIFTLHARGCCPDICAMVQACIDQPGA